MTRFVRVAVIAAIVGTACSSSPAPTTLPSSTPPPTASPTPAGSNTGSEATAGDEPTSRPPADPSQVDLAYEVWADGFAAPLFAAPRPGTDEVWVIEQGGAIWSVLEGGGRDQVADLSGRVSARGEQGLLGLAFPLDHADTGEFVVHYSAAADGAGIIERWRLAPQVGAEPIEVVLRVEQPARNHNGGMVQFGPDGMLWVGLGDGGGAGDQFGHGQRADTLLGTILRLDLSASPYAIPDDNPFVDGSTPDGSAAAPEVWAYGLRNPWRFWIDGAVMWIGDVGQNAVEEVDVVGLEKGGANLGWPVFEGTSCFDGPCDGAGQYVQPIAEYRHDGGACSITGGVVNRGDLAPDLHGHYFYSDFCAGFLRSLRVGSDGRAIDATDWTEQVGTASQVLSFGTDQRGNVLVLGADGTIRRIVQR